ncbi:MAG: non-homologous end-joining DNA ligase [Myxococcales bacterium]|nr:non-homologous end-joining DNA ligase [Myxococcales bacterium]
MARAKETIGVGDHSIELSSQDKEMYPADGITKGDLVTYYLEVAATMLPYLEGRPITVQRYTSGIGRPGFVQKEAGEHYPDWIPRVTVPKSDGGATHYPLIEDAAALIYLVNQNCIVFHTVTVRRERLAHPDLFVMDLDPSDDDFNKVRRGALLLKELFEEIGLVPFVKTTGSRGLHVVAPIVPEQDTVAAEALARTLASRVCARAPDTFTTDISKKKRGDRVFVDYLRNGYMQTAAAPYSLRAIDGAPAATPVTWAELADESLTARSYNLRNMAERLRKVGDPWRGMWRHARSLIAASERLR